MKRFSALIVAIVMIFTLTLCSFSASAVDYGCDVDTYSSNVYIENLDTGIVVFEDGANQQVPPASLTKIMTYIVTVENIKDLENTMVTITEDMLTDLDPESSVMGLTDYIGEQFSVRDLLYGLMLPSGNDSALVLAQVVGGDVDTFVSMMNDKAKSLKCKDTHFVNPHGLYDDDHYSTAYDLSVITKYAIDLPYFKEITSTYQYDVEGMDEPLETTNYTIDPSYSQYYYEYIEGGKTGYTDEAGKCLITTANNGDYRYLCILLGSPFSYAENVNYAMLDSKDLYEWAFQNISYKEILPNTESLKSVEVQYVWGDVTVDAMPSEQVVALLPNDYEQSLVTTKVEADDIVSAPVTKGQELGLVSVYYDDELISTTKLISTVDIKRDNLNYYLHKFFEFLKNNAVVIIIVLVVIIALWVTISVSNRRHKERMKRRQNRRYR